MDSSFDHDNALELCATLLCPGKKWKLSRYVLDSLDTTQSRELVRLVPVYQSVFLDLLSSGHVQDTLDFVDIGSPSGVGAMAITDAWLAWLTAQTVFGRDPTSSTILVPRVANTDSRAAQHLYSQFRGTVARRTAEQPTLAPILSPDSWPKILEALRGHRTQVVFCAQPWRHTDTLRRLMSELADGAVVVGLNWPDSGDDGSVFQWRRALIDASEGWVAAGPCGQEYGRELPEACNTCYHGRAELIHYGLESTEHAEPCVWNYAMLTKAARPIEQLDGEFETVDVLADRTMTGVHLRYLGTWRKQVLQTQHPDAVEDNPNQGEWMEQLLVCPGNTGSQALGILRRAGMQVPRLRYGQWLKTNDLRWYPKTADYVLTVTNEASFHHEAAPASARTYLSSYSPLVRAAVDEAAFRLFGFPEMRPFQHRILERSLCGRDIFAIAATGGGKSECYILASMLLPGVTVVVAPLKSLIQDQYEQRIRDRFGLDYLTTFIDGDVPFYERQGRLRRMVLGHYRLVYMTPEQLERGHVLDALRQANEAVGVRYLAMDEAHCISQWGHDFRPAYLNIVQRLEGYGLTPTRIALTATASPLVRDDVCHELHLDKRPLENGGDVFIDSSNRPELNLVVYRARDSVDKARFIVDSLRKLDEGSAIVFMPHTGGPVDQPRDYGAPSSVPNPEYVGMVSPGVTPFASFLQRHLGTEVALYHGALEDKANDGDGEADDETAVLTRQEQQRKFMAGHRRVMVATKGFGMGVDKPDIRLVIHRSPPGNLEAYAQEAGRAGRDGKPSTVVLLFSEDGPQITDVLPNVYLSRTILPSDRDIQQYFIDQRYVERGDVGAMLAFLRSDQASHPQGLLYFTNDQVMDFFDQWPGYKWPRFQPREYTGSKEHIALLTRGYFYAAKQKHIGRILSVIFNNRPTIDGKLMPAVRSVHEAGAIARRLRLFQAEKILASPVYFGEALREAHIDSSELGKLLPDRSLVDITPLAERLGLSLRETTSMLSDIRTCEGRTDSRGHWVGTLLNYWWIEAPRRVSIPDPYDNLAAWREYAGARRRAKPASGRQGLDDYFPWGVVNGPMGWEVEPGPGLSYENPERYLDSFMALHDQRQRNDQGNFAYLIDRYIGADGRSRECLRSLLLGYLKTNEVILGGNCHSCSVCVPDLNFDQHPIEDRCQAVARLMQSTIDQFDRLEDAARRAPSMELLDALLDAVASEDAAGRSGIAYLDSWLARVIQDDAQHQGALWMRLRCFTKGTLPLSPEDIVNALERLVDTNPDASGRRQIEEIVTSHLGDPDYTGLKFRLLSLAATLAGARHAWVAEADLWRQALGAQRLPDQDRVRVQYRLFVLYKDHIKDSSQAAEFAQQLLDSPRVSQEQARTCYQYLASSWSQQKLLTYLEQRQRPYREAGLQIWLAGLRPRLQADAVAWLCHNQAIVAGATPAFAGELEQRLRPEIGTAPELLVQIADRLGADPAQTVNVARLLVEAWAQGQELTSAQLGQLAAGMHALDARWCHQQISNCSSDVVRLFQSLVAAAGESTLSSDWFRLFPADLVKKVPAELLPRLFDIVLHDSDALGKAAEILLTRVDELEPARFLEAAEQMIARQPSLAIKWLSVLPPQSRSIGVLAESFLERALRRDRSDSPSMTYLDSLIKAPISPEPRSRMAACLSAWRALSEDRATWPKLRQYRIEGSVLVDLYRRWIAKTDDVHRFDLLVVILQDVERRSLSTWMTPISLEFQALCAAGRFAEAGKILATNPDIHIPGHRAANYLRAATATRPERTVAYEAELEHLWSLARLL